MQLLCFVLLTVVLPVALAGSGSCRGSRLCCDGKNADCVVQKSTLDAILDDDEQDDEPCYCDHGCLEVGDCCDDFKDYCGVIDCEVSDWSDWSDCDVSCGVGTSVRTREVLRPEANGGIQCPGLEEKKTCQASRCGTDRLERISAFHETAMLLPGKYAKPNLVSRMSNYDVRSNLKSYRAKESKEYCAVFTVEKSKHSCEKHKETHSLSRGNQVCVLCDDKAQRDHLGGRCTGHGVEGKMTTFKSLFNPHCHGKWVRKQLVEGPCPCKGRPHFIFV